MLCSMYRFPLIPAVFCEASWSSIVGFLREGCVHGHTVMEELVANLPPSCSEEHPDIFCTQCGWPHLASNHQQQHNLGLVAYIVQSLRRYVGLYAEVCEPQVSAYLVYAMMWTTGTALVKSMEDCTPSVGECDVRNFQASRAGTFLVSAYNALVRELVLTNPLEFEIVPLESWRVQCTSSPLTLPGTVDPYEEFKTRGVQEHDFSIYEAEGFLIEAVDSCEYDPGVVFSLPGMTPRNKIFQDWRLPRLVTSCIQSSLDVRSTVLSLTRAMSTTGECKCSYSDLLVLKTSGLPSVHEDCLRRYRTMVKSSDLPPREIAELLRDDTRFSLPPVSTFRSEKEAGGEACSRCGLEGHRDCEISVFDKAEALLRSVGNDIKRRHAPSLIAAKLVDFLSLFWLLVSFRQEVCMYQDLETRRPGDRVVTRKKQKALSALSTRHRDKPEDPTAYLLAAYMSVWRTFKEMGWHSESFRKMFCFTRAPLEIVFPVDRKVSSLFAHCTIAGVLGKRKRQRYSEESDSDSMCISDNESF